MIISPDRITYPDTSVQTTAVSGGGVSAPLNLSGSITTGMELNGPA